MGEWDQNGSHEDWLGGIEWIRLAQDMDDAVMNLRVLAPWS
jgi:hypothetical protein